MTPVVAHRINLSGFWTSTEPAPGRVRYVRRFGRPRTLGVGETAWLVGTSPGDGTLSVNGRAVCALTGGQGFAADISGLLQGRNEAVMETTADGPLGEVAMEIRASG